MRAKFEGTPEKVINLFSFIAEEVRNILASLGVKRLRDVIGRTEYLRQVSRGAEWLDDLDLNPLLVQADPGGHERYCTAGPQSTVPETLDAQMIADAAPLIRAGREDAVGSTISATRIARSARNCPIASPANTEWPRCSRATSRFGSGVRPGSR